jgi:hypothetical protein
MKAREMNASAEAKKVQELSLTHTALGLPDPR